MNKGRKTIDTLAIVIGILAVLSIFWLPPVLSSAGLSIGRDAVDVMQMLGVLLSAVGLLDLFWTARNKTVAVPAVLADQTVVETPAAAVLVAATGDES